MNENPVERFLALCAQMEAHRRAGPDWTLYEKLKGSVYRDFVNLEPSDYERLIKACAKAAGV